MRASTKPDLPLSALTAISGIDGRYGRLTAELRPFFSEYGLIRQRLRVEIEYLRVLAAEPGVREVPQLSHEAAASLTAILDNFDVKEAEKVKKLEATTNHDVKAVEYYLKDAFATSAASRELLAISEFTHFACTSEDVSNLAYACLVSEVRAGTPAPPPRSRWHRLEASPLRCLATGPAARRPPAHALRRRRARGALW